MCLGLSARRSPPHGLVDGAIGATGGGRARTLAHATDAMLLLGQVGEVEVEAEGPDELLDPIIGELLEDGPEAALACGRARCPDVARQPPDALDQVQQLFAGLLSDDLPEQGPQELDLARERVASP